MILAPMQPVGSALESGRGGSGSGAESVGANQEVTETAIMDAESKWAVKFRIFA